MTRQEAIKLIDDRMCFGRGKWSKHHEPEIDEYWQAGQMAIEALKEQDPKQGENGSELFGNAEKLDDRTTDGTDKTVSSEDTVSRQAAIEALYNVMFDDDLKPTIVTAKQADTIMDSIRWLPSAQPEIIRCKDCKYKNVYRFPPQYYERDYCEKHEKVVDVANFCSWAERREE